MSREFRSHRNSVPRRSSLRTRKGQTMRGGNEGPNWILLAGGAAVTALSFLIGRRQKQGFENEVEEREGNAGKTQLANHKDGFEPDYRDVETAKAYSHQDSFDHRTSAYPEDYSRSGLEIVCTAERDMLHRLRKQLKSRDKMIIDMQVQISEYERSLTLSDARVEGLQDRLEAISKVLSDLNQEVQLLGIQLADFQSADEQCSQSVFGRADSMTNTGDDCKDMFMTVEELKKLRGVVDRLKEEINAKESERQDLSQEYMSMLQEMDRLERALKEQRRIVTAKEQLILSNEKEFSRITSSLQEMQHQLDTQAEEMEALRHTKEKLEACIHLLNSKGCNELDLHGSEEIISSTSTEGSDSWNHHRDGRGDFGQPELERLGQVSDNAEDTDRKAVSDSMVAALEQEVEQLSTALASQSKVVCEQKEKTAKLFEDLQVVGTKDTMQPIWDSAPETLKSEDPKWVHLPQQVSSAISAATPAERNDLSSKLIAIAERKKVKEKLEDIRKYQAKIVELRQRISKFTRDSTDEVRNEQTLHVAALICGLAEKLAAQEEQARHTAMEVQQLSESFQLLAPIMATFQIEEADTELERRNSSEETLGCDIEDVKYKSPRSQSRREDQGDGTKGAGSLQSGQEDTASSSDVNENSSNRQSPLYMSRELADEDYLFKVGASKPVASKNRKLSSKWDVKSERRKNYIPHVYDSEERTDTTTSANHWVRNTDHDNDSYLKEHIHMDVLQDYQSSPKAQTDFQDPESISSQTSPHDHEHLGDSAGALPKAKLYSPYEVEQVMATGTPDHETTEFVPTFEEFSPPVQQVRGHAEGSGSSRRYLFKSDNDQGDHGQELEASTGYSVTAAESGLEEESTSGSLFLIPRSESTSLSPFSKMIARLDSTDELSTPNQGASVADVTDSLDADTSKMGRVTAEQEVESASDSGYESRGSIDSEFNDILDGTLDDLVKIFSTNLTPAGTPTSSALSQGSDL